MKLNPQRAEETWTYHMMTILWLLQFWPNLVVPLKMRYNEHSVNYIIILFHNYVCHNIVTVHKVLP